MTKATVLIAALLLAAPAVGGAEKAKTPAKRLPPPTPMMMAHRQPSCATPDAPCDTGKWGGRLADVFQNARGRLRSLCRREKECGSCEPCEPYETAVPCRFTRCRALIEWLSYRPGRPCCTGHRPVPCCTPPLYAYFLHRCPPGHGCGVCAPLAPRPAVPPGKVDLHNVPAHSPEPLPVYPGATGRSGAQRSSRAVVSDRKRR